jgi:hypothetical protein
VRFDAYAGSIRLADPSVVVNALAHALSGNVEEGPRFRRWGPTLQVNVSGRQAVWVGHDEAAELVYFEGKGETSPLLAAAVRLHFPTHSVARADVCIDFDAPGAFEATLATIRENKGARVKGAFDKLPDDPEDGRTWGAGVRGGVAFCRLYEAGKHPDRRHFCRPDWVRAELEARPHYAVHKEASSRLDPASFWGLTAWSTRVGQALTQTAIPRVEVEQEHAHEGTTSYVARRFRRHFEAELAAGIDLARTFRQIWADDDETERRWRELRRTPSAKEGGEAPDA